MATMTVDGIEVDEDIAIGRFSCDLSRCKGACCTLPGGKGAPISREEVDILLLAVPVVKKYLPQEHIDVIDSTGVVEKANDLYYTVCINNGACVFVSYDHGIALCSIERAHFAGEFAWRKPLSCHLFPIRRSYGTRERIRYEYLDECEPAIESGNKNNMPMYDFLRDALIRAYGAPWYEEFRKQCKQRDTQNGKTINFDSE